MFNINRFQNESILKTHRLMAENLYDKANTAYLMKNSAYLESANSLMLRVIQHGFIDYWTTKSLLSDKHITFMLDIEKIENMAVPASPLSISRILGSLMIYWFGIFVSMVAFGTELIIFRRNANKYITTLY